MSGIRLSILALLCLGVVACAQIDRQAELQVTNDSIERQVLVMLRLPAPHFRPDVNYAGSYDRGAGRDARRQIAELLAKQYGLKVIDGWPMPALGVDCFVMEAPGTASLAQIVEKLSLDPRVESAQPVHLFRVLAHNDPLYPLQPSAKRWHLDELHKITMGRRVRVAEVDTGVDVNHPDLSGRVAVARNFVDGRRDVAESHGTAVAGMLFIWIVILFTYLRFRAALTPTQVAQLPIRMPAHRAAAGFGIVSLAAITATTFFVDGLRYTVPSFLPFLVVMSVVYARTRGRARA